MIQNVLDHDADPTGRTDSTHAFYAALEALSPGGGIVQIPAGFYLIAGAPLRLIPPEDRPLPKAIIFMGEGGVGRTASTMMLSPILGHASGSATTLIFPLEADGFLIEMPGITLENLALIRGYDFHFSEGSPHSKYERRGIYSKCTFFGRNLYLARWNRAIDLDGRPGTPMSDDSRVPNVNLSRLENIVAEDCYWATYTRGNDAQGGHFSRIYALQCQAGIYDSSLAGNGYTDCYVEAGAGNEGAPYYMDSTSQLRNCRAESSKRAQLGQLVQVLGGTFLGAPPPNHFPDDLPDWDPTRTFLKPFEGIPARIDSKNLPDSWVFDRTEQLTITIDHSGARTVEFLPGSYTAAVLAAIINHTFSDFPTIATVDVFDNALIIEGQIPYSWGEILIREELGSNVFQMLYGMEESDGSTVRTQQKNGLNRAQIMVAGEYSGLVFKGSSGLGRPYEETKLVEVQLAPRGDAALLWKARGYQQQKIEFGLIHHFEGGTRRWAFSQGPSPRLNGFLSFTYEGDAYGDNQLIANNGIWLHGLNGILLCNGTPLHSQGDTGDRAWDMSSNPPQSYVRTDAGWEVE
ncbi:MAG: hypothetical protein HUU01_07645 [Saprospiraceae bacterium]|nr:hypothetical protein [Saprospiraceae bacterium]